MSDGPAEIRLHMHRPRVYAVTYPSGAVEYVNRDGVPVCEHCGSHPDELGCPVHH